MTVPDLDAIRAALTAHVHETKAGKTRASVAAVLRVGVHGPEVLLIKRAEHPDDPWSGHMAFPGGREEEQDDDLVQTAVRETREEIGIDLARAATLLGPLDDVEAVGRGKRMGLIVRPHVFELRTRVEATPNYEVDEVLWAPIAPLVLGEAKATRQLEVEGRTYRFPAYDVDGRIVWGLTYWMLQLLFETVR